MKNFTRNSFCRGRARANEDWGLSNFFFNVFLNQYSSRDSTQDMKIFAKVVLKPSSLSYQRCIDMCLKWGKSVFDSENLSVNLKIMFVEKLLQRKSFLLYISTFVNLI